ncbi:electron transport complex, RnfABCDGE type, G subunit [Salinivirga cyanobacteriivorans]|uniref:Electron transport complex, RnfABCDGE type, G subunit n=1 Tax=Salinivirga cyanobacteriivorans TaxID=1307839 RepID=A0A0S2I5X4_9BACT|nr:4Fe-4S binding protein [Salinivirga cyanobacteriivorans]ALO17372.1 electron transport complex, RnfABCDGE type, G subunit [Salinivirga cyanobacteriivorans]
MRKKQIEATVYQYTLIIIILIALAYRGGRDFLFQKNEAEITVELKDIQEIYPRAANYELNRHGAYDVYGKKNQKIGTALLSSNYTKQFGYGGRVPLLIGIDDNLTITEVLLLPNNETSDYIQAIYGDEFIGKWEGVNLEDATQFQVDIISGATHTSKAVIAGVKHTASSVMKSDASVIAETSLWATIKDMLFLSLMLLSLVMVFKKGTAKYRTIYMFLVLVIMGLIFNNALSAQLLHGWLKDGFAWRANWQTAVVFLLALTVSFIGKRKFYCNYLCPMGALQELTNRFTPFKKRKLPTTYKGLSVREVYLVLIAGALLLGFSPELSYTEPFMFFSFRVVGIGLIMFGLIVILLSLFFTKPWCAVCPTGCFLDTVSYQKAKKLEF